VKEYNAISVPFAEAINVSTSSVPFLCQKEKTW
jgi:hypothetical protein